MRQKLRNRRLKKEGKTPLPLSLTVHFKNSWLLFQNKRKTYAVIAILFGINCLIFNSNLAKYTTAENKHISAKYYFTVGETANTVKMALINVLHPDFPLLIPIEWFQKVVYWHGSFMLPPEDDEKYLWQKLWFYNPYVITQNPPWGVRARLDTPLYNSKHFSRFYNDYMIVLEKVMDGNIADKKLFYETVPRDISSDLEFSVIFQMYHDGLRYTGEAGIRIAKVEKYQKQTANFYRYSTVADQWWKDKVIPESIRSVVEQRLTFLEARYAILEAVMFEQFLQGPVRCSDTSVTEYLAHRKVFAEEIPLAYQKRFGMMLNDKTSRFYNYLFPTYCKNEFPAPPVKVQGEQFSYHTYIDISEANIRKGMGYDLQDSENNVTLAPLFNALKEKNTEKVLFELDKNHFSPDVRFYGEKTSLHYAAHSNDQKTLQALIARGASVNIEDKAGKIPLQYAIQNYSYDTAKYLLDNGSTHKWVADTAVSFTTASWEYVMDRGSKYSKSEVARLLKLIIEYKIDLFAKASKCNLTFLHIAHRDLILIQNREYVGEIIQLLLKEGLNFREKNCHGKNAFDYTLMEDTKIKEFFYPYMTDEEKQQLKNKK